MFSITNSGTTSESGLQSRNMADPGELDYPRDRRWRMDRGQRQALVQDLASHDHLRSTSYAEADDRVVSAISLETWKKQKVRMSTCEAKVSKTSTNLSQPSAEIAFT